MKSHELFIIMPTALAEGILEEMHGLDRQIYKAVLDAVAQARKVRALFLERLPRAQRHTMVVNTLGRKSSDTIADNLIRTWLLKKHTPLLTEFLDALKIPHEKGMVEEIPDEMEDGLLRGAVEAVLKTHPQDVVAIYLHAFHEMNDPKWANLGTILDKDGRLQLETPAVTVEQG